MSILVLTQTTGILRPFAIILGFIMNYIYRFLEMFGISNIGLTIILFTLAINLLMIPLTIKQQKFTKMSSIMNPEIKKIQKKYANRKDEYSMRMMQAETSAVYEKYGASPTGGCLPLLIQLPILFALYRVIYNVPAYVEPVKTIYESIATPIMNAGSAAEIMENVMSELSITVSNFDITDINKIIDALYKVKTTGWETVSALFASSPDVVSAVASYSDKIMAISWLPGGLSIADAPVNFSNGFSGLFPGVLIPALAGFSQWLNMKVSMKNQPEMDKDSAMGSSMNTMNTIMPFFSVFICISLPAGVGIYWIASAVFRTIIYIFVDKFFSVQDIDKIIEENKEKAAKKAEKRGKRNEKLEEYAAMKTSSIKPKTISELANTSVEGKGNYKKNNNSAESKKVEKTSNTENTQKKNSISGYANMLKRHDD